MKLVSMIMVIVYVIIGLCMSAHSETSIDSDRPVCRQGRALTFWYDQAAFEAAHPGLSIESWDLTNVPPGLHGYGYGPFNSTTDNECFSPGAIIEGINVGITDCYMMVWGIGASENSTVRFGPTASSDDYRVDFDRNTLAFGTRVFMNETENLLHIDVYNSLGGIIDSDTISDISWDDPGTFWGVSSDHPTPDISYIIFRTAYLYTDFFSLHEWLITPEADYVFWTEYSMDSIARANVDGTGVNLNWITGCQVPMSVTTDGRYIYWTNWEGTIGRADYDGSNINQTWITGCDNSDGIAVDDNYIYWTNHNSIGRANLDGSGVNQNFVIGYGGISTEMTVDSNYIYWGITDYHSVIARASIDGSIVEENFIPASSEGVILFGLDVDSRYVYWSEYGPNNICRANLDGTGIDYTWITGCSEPRSVEVDRSFVYWINSNPDTVGRADLNGSSHLNQSWITGLDQGMGFGLGKILCFNDGDVNNDDTLTAEDAQQAFSIVMAHLLPSYQQECSADCNGSGTVTAGDAQSIFGAVLGLDSCVDPA